MELNRLKEIINKPSDYSNKNLEFESLQFLSENFEDKKRLFKLTRTLRFFTEDSYNKILKNIRKELVNEKDNF